MTKKILIIGAVAAGPKAACRAKRLMQDAEITVIDMDNLISYGGCGIPFYVSGEVADEKSLRSTTYHMLRDEGYFTDCKGVNILTRTKALSINRKEKTVLVKNLDSGNEEELKYDNLVLATGSSPNILPIAGNNLDGVFAISDLHKAIEIKERLAKGQVSNAVIIGGGAIGLEMAEAFADMWGINTTVIEFMPQLLPRILPKTIAMMLEKHLKDKGITVHTGMAAKEIKGIDGKVTAVVTGTEEIPTDIVVMAAGVRPRSELARDAGLNVSQTGGIVVNNRMQTSDPAIYACGDCVEILNPLTGKRTIAPMGSLANREGRVVGDNLAGIPSTFNGWVGSFIMKAFDICVGGTGLSIEAARAEGYDAIEGLSCSYDRTHFYPESSLMFLTLVVDRKTSRILGLQGYANMGDALLARINAVAAILDKHPVVEDISNMELAYAPPFATAVDTLNFAAYISDNMLSGKLRTVELEDFLNWMDGKTDNPDWMVLDVRHEREARPFVKKFADKWISVPYNKVRYEMDKIPKNKNLIIMCNAAGRSYEIQCFLDGKDYKNTYVLLGAANLLKRLDIKWWP